MYRVGIPAVVAICEVCLTFSAVCCLVSVSAYNVQSYLAVLHGASDGLHQSLTPDFRTCHLRRSALECGDGSAYAPIPMAAWLHSSAPFARSRAISDYHCTQHFYLRWGFSSFLSELKCWRMRGFYGFRLALLGYNDWPSSAWTWGFCVWDTLSVSVPVHIHISVYSQIIRTDNNAKVAALRKFIKTK